MRQADWRYLIPPATGGVYERMVVVGAAARTAEWLRDAGIAREVRTDMSTEGNADVVAVLGQSHRAISPSAAAESVRPGGVLYFEVDRKASPGPRWAIGRVTRELRRFGARVVGSYWVRPSFDRQLFLPLDSDNALRWFLQNEFPRATVVQLTKATILRAILSVEAATWVRRVAKRYAIVARIDGGTVGRRDTVEGLSNPALPPEYREPGNRAILVARGVRDEPGKVVIIPFSRGARNPVGVVKLERVATERGVAEVEYENLRRVRERLDPDLRRCIAEPRGIVRTASGVVTAETYLPGIVLESARKRWGVGIRTHLRDYRMATDWITRFAVQTQSSDRDWREETHERYVEAFVRRYAEEIDTTPEERRLIERVSERSRSLFGSTLPVVWTHGDYSPWNLALTGGRLSVFDWEGAGEGLPLADLLYFTRYWYRLLSGSDGQEDRWGEIRLLLPPDAGAGRIHRLVNEAIEAYLAALGIDPVYRPVALVVPWLQRVLLTARRAKEFGEDSQQTASRRRAVLAMALHQDLLFSTSAESADSVAT